MKRSRESVDVIISHQVEWINLVGNTFLVVFNKYNFAIFFKLFWEKRKKNLDHRKIVFREEAPLGINEPNEEKKSVKKP